MRKSGTLGLPPWLSAPRHGEGLPQRRDIVTMFQSGQDRGRGGPHCPAPQLSASGRARGAGQAFYTRYFSWDSSGVSSVLFIFNTQTAVGFSSEPGWTQPLCQELIGVRGPEKVTPGLWGGAARPGAGRPSARCLTIEGTMLSPSPARRQTDPKTCRLPAWQHLAPVSIPSAAPEDGARANPGAACQPAAMQPHACT